MKAWHFVGATLRDGRPVPADGVTLVHRGQLEMCASGLHASIDPFDALQFARGETLCEVECGGVVIHSTDKLVCSERTILRRMDFTEPLHYFTRMQALSVVHLWTPPDVVLDYLMTGDDAIRVAARDAASAAARDAESAAESAAARAAELSAVLWILSLAASFVEESDAARSEFGALVNECFGDYA